MSVRRKLARSLRASIDTEGSDPADIVVDGTAGNLWMGIDSTLYRFDLQARFQELRSTASRILAMGLQRPTSTLWVAQENRIDRFDQDGGLLGTIPAEPGLTITDLAYDRRLDQCWVPFADRLRRYDSSGATVFEAL